LTTGRGPSQYGDVRSETLNALSDEDLRAIADRMGLGLPPDLERIFVVEEILEALEEDRLEEDRGAETPLYFEDVKYRSSEERVIEASPAPRLEPRYNETMIKALVRDPSWAFAFWDIAESERQAFEAVAEDWCLFLRITEASLPEDEKPLFFDIPVTIDDFQWYINLPRPEASYRIDLAAKLGSRSRVLARSGEIGVPRQRMAARSLPEEARRLLELSGLRDLAIEDADDDNPARILKADASGAER
jgi:uncharacterized protein